MFAKNDEHRQCDSCIMFVMSHGVDTKYTQLTHTVNIAAYDGQYVNSQDIISPLMPKRCKALGTTDYAGMSLGLKPNIHDLMTRGQIIKVLL
ncbi:hypothetical protein J6590_063399 [Homalodisca vitripennis]|nr:hypothetical protein J6590_063399 [Homalodisca vitripennis]